MSVTNQTDRTYGSGNSVTTAFSFLFKIFDATELLVYLLNTSTNALTGPLTLNTDYSVSINTVTEGGTVNFTVAPATGYQYIIKRSVPYTQTAVIPSEGTFPGKQFENQLDLMTMMIIQNNSLISNMIQMPSTYLGSALTFPLPSANTVIGWDPTGEFLVNLVVGGQGPTGPQGPKGDTGASGSGTVTTISSANSDISVANPTTTPVLTLNSGTGANKIVKLDSSGKLPAVDGSQLTNLPIANSFFVPNNIQVFTSTGTWTKPAGVTKVYVKAWGAGGGGAGAGGSPATGGGGGGGGYSEGFTTVSGNVAVTVGTGGTAGASDPTNGGTGGTSSFAGAATIQGTGGNGGATTAAGLGGTGGTGSGGQINISGTKGGNGSSAAANGLPIGYGGAAFAGIATALNSVNGVTYGSGGSAATTNVSGGAGHDGLVIVYY